MVLTQPGHVAIFNQCRWPNMTMWPYWVNVIGPVWPFAYIRSMSMTQSSNVPILGQWCPEHLRTSAPGWGISHKHLIGPAMTANFWPRITWVQSSSPLKMFVVHLPGLLVMSSSLECLCLWDTPLPFWVKHIHVHWSILLPGLCYTKGKYVSKGWLRWSVQVLEQYISSTWTIIEFPWNNNCISMEGVCDSMDVWTHPGVQTKTEESICHFF